eukprot:590226-Hanusia_phi.AAC.2
MQLYRPVGRAGHVRSCLQQERAAVVDGRRGLEDANTGPARPRHAERQPLPGLVAWPRPDVVGEADMHVWPGVLEEGDGGLPQPEGRRVVDGDDVDDEEARLGDVGPSEPRASVVYQPRGAVDAPVEVRGCLEGETAVGRVDGGQADEGGGEACRYDERDLLEPLG